MNCAGEDQADHRMQAGPGPCSIQAGSPGGVYFPVEQDECGGDQAKVTSGQQACTEGGMLHQPQQCTDRV